MLYFVDRSGPLTNKRRTATGGYLVDATLARVGVMDYPERKQRHYNSPEVLQANLDAIVTAPVTNRHPSTMVTADTYQEVACGHVVGTPSFKEGKVFATLAIQDANLIADIESGFCREVSMGYIAHAEPAQGEFEGQVYDTVRKEIEWNHIAVVPAGRAGKDVCLCLDSAEIPGEETSMFTVNGKEYGADKVQAAIDALEMLLTDAKGEVGTLTARVGELTGELTTAKSQETIDAAVAAELVKREGVAKAAVRKEKVAKRYPKMNLEGKSQETIDTLFETVEAEESEITDAAPGAAGGEPSAERQEPTVVVDAAPKPSARQRMLANARKMSAARPAEGE